MRSRQDVDPDLLRTTVEIIKLEAGWAEVTHYTYRVGKGVIFKALDLPFTTLEVMWNQNWELVEVTNCYSVDGKISRSAQPLQRDTDTSIGGERLIQEIRHRSPHSVVKRHHSVPLELELKTPLERAVEPQVSIAGMRPHGAGGDGVNDELTS